MLGCFHILDYVDFLRLQLIVVLLEIQDFSLDRCMGTALSSGRLMMLMKACWVERKNLLKSSRRVSKSEND
jgi:hypothetical protein